MKKYRVGVEYKGEDATQSRDFVVQAESPQEAKAKVEASVKVWYAKEVEFTYGKRLHEKSLGMTMFE